MAACSYIALFIAGARTSGDVHASAALVRRLSASPAASFAIVLADAGAITYASHRRTSSRWEIGSWSGDGLAGIGAARGVALELVREHGGAGDALERRGADEPLGGGRLHDAHGMARARREPHQLNSLVCGDPTGYAEQDPRHPDLRARRGTCS